MKEEILKTETLKLEIKNFAEVDILACPESFGSFPYSVGEVRRGN